MKKNNRSKFRWIGGLTAILAGCSILSGCLYSHTRVGGIEPQARIIDQNYRVLGESEGKSSSFNLLWIIPVTPRVSYERAVYEAISKLSGDNLIDVRTWLERQIWFGGMVEILHVKGKVIQYTRDR